MDLDAAKNARRSLIESVAILAAPGDAQVAWLASLGTRPLADELGLEFDDWFRLLPELESLHVVSSVAARLSGEVSAILDEVPKTEWTESAIATSPTWEQVRRHAGLALVALLESSPKGRKVSAPAVS